MKLIICFAVCLLASACFAGSTSIFTLRVGGSCVFPNSKNYNCNLTSTTNQALTFVGPKLVQTTWSPVGIGSGLTAIVKGDLPTPTSFSETWSLSIENSTLVITGTGTIFNGSGFGAYNVVKATGMWAGSTGGATVVVNSSDGTTDIEGTLTFLLLQ